MAYPATTYYSSKDKRYPPTNVPANVPAPPSPYGVYRVSPQSSLSHPATAQPYTTYSNATIHRSQAPSQHQPLHSYPSPHSSSRPYDPKDPNYPSPHPSAPAPPTYPASPIRPYSCDQCALSFDRSHDLKRHRDSHSGAKPFECNSCRRSFTRKDALKRHQSQKHCGLEDA